MLQVGRNRFDAEDEALSGKSDLIVERDTDDRAALLSVISMNTLVRTVNRTATAR